MPVALEITATKFEMAGGNFSSDKRYFREPVLAADRVFYSPRVATWGTVITSDDWVGWTFRIGSYTRTWNGPSITNSTRNIAV